MAAVTEESLRRRGKEPVAPESDAKAAAVVPATPKTQLASSDWNGALRKLMRLLPFISVPLIGLPASYVYAQEHAFETWQPVRCIVHDSDLKDMTRERRGMATLRLRAEWAPKVRYSYAFPAGAGNNFTSENVYYFKKLTTPTKTEVMGVTRAFRPGGRCVTFVNPERPSESLLVREAWFRPYSYLLLAVGAVLFSVWYAAIEHDWGAFGAGGEFVPVEGDSKGTWYLTRSGEEAPAADAGKWYRIPTQVWIASPVTLLKTLVVPCLWFAVGYLVWQRYSSGRHNPNGSEQVLMFYAAGGVMLLRWVYQAVLAVRVAEPELCVDAQNLAVGEPRTVRFRQRKRGMCGALTYDSAEVRLELRETTREAKEQGKRALPSSKIKYDNTVVLVKNDRLPDDADGIEARADFSIPPVRVRVSSETKPVRNVWTLTLCIKLRYVPLKYIVSLPVDVHVPEMFQEEAR